MNHDEFMNIITHSEPSDWIYDDSHSTYTFSTDMSISIIGEEIDYEDSGLFHEAWATQLPDPHARRKTFTLCYNGNVLETFYTASVDGSRMYIPYPNLETMTISETQYAIGRIINIPNEAYGFDSYLTRCNISVN